MDDQPTIHPAATVHLPIGEDKYAVFEPLALIPHRRGFLVNDEFHPLPSGVSNFDPVEIVSVDGHNVVVNCKGAEYDVRSGNLDVGWHFTLPGQAALRETDLRVWDWLEARLEDSSKSLPLHETLVLKTLKARCDKAADHMRWMNYLEV